MTRSVGEIISGELLSEKGFEKVRLAYSVFEVVREVLGEGLSSQVKIYGFDNGTVWIKTPSSTFSHELSFFEEEIVKKVNAVLGDKVVKRIRFEESWKTKRFRKR